MSVTPRIAKVAIAPAVEADVRSVTSDLRPNALIEGHVADIAMLFANIARELREPITVWSGGVLSKTDTLIVPNIDRLDRSQQQQLDRWVTNRRSRVQVISTCSQSLFALVERRAFSSDLYYRLNLVRIRV